MTENFHPNSPLVVGGVPEHVSLPWYTAIDEGRLPGIVWIDQPSGTGSMVAALDEGRLDVAVALTEGVVVGITAGLDARIVAVSIPSPLQWGIHVAADSEFWEPGDLVGARAAISRRGSGSHLMAYVLADLLRWEPDDVAHFVEIGDVDGARSALRGGDADYFLWDRFMTQPLVDAGEFRRIGVQPTPWPAFVVVARTQVVERRGVELATALEVIADTAAALSARADLVELIAERFELPTDTVTQWRKVTEWAAAGERLDPSTLSAVQETLFALGHIDEVLPPDRILAEVP